MTVVVTGAAGFLGSAVVRHLCARGDNVVAIDRRPVARRAGVVPIRADLCLDDPGVRAAVRRADAVIHLAGCPGIRDRLPDVERRRQRDNVDATSAVVAATPWQVPLVVASSSSVYGGARFGRASREGDPCHPLGGYAASKVRTEQVCHARLDAGAPVVVARPFTVIGEGQRPDMALSRWVDATRLGRPLRIFGSLERTRDFTDVREVARALTALLGSTSVVNVGSGRPRTLGEAVDAVGSVLGVEPLVRIEPASADEVADTWADTSRLADLTGQVPQTDLVDAVERLVAAPALAAVG